jgi:pimeloyl-ACP methyl ester carboxylesterase
MATFVLVPGFWLGAWAWAEVTPRLRAAGHDVYPVTLTGLAERAGEADPAVNVDTHVADLVGLVRTASLRDVILVGHSGANMAVTGAADLLGPRVARVVYVDSGPMPSGLASIDFHDPQGQRASWPTCSPRWLSSRIRRCGYCCCWCRCPAWRRRPSSRTTGRPRC